MYNQKALLIITFSGKGIAYRYVSKRTIQSSNYTGQNAI